MRRDTQGAVLVAVGSVLVSLTVSGGFQAYVRTGLRVPLLLAGLCLAALGGLAIIVRPEASIGDDGHGHGHASMRVGVLLLAFVGAAYLIAPAPLGSYAAERGDENRITATAPRTDLFAATPPKTSEPAAAPQVPHATVVTTTSPTAINPPGLPSPPRPATEASAGSPETPSTVPTATATEAVESVDPVELTLYDFLTYTYLEPDQIRGVSVRLTGFVAAEPDVAGAYRLTRFLMACCAADAFPLQVIVTGSSAIPPDDQWLSLDVVWDGAMIDVDEYTQIPVVRAVEQRDIDAPAQPYEY